MRSLLLCVEVEVWSIVSFLGKICFIFELLWSRREAERALITYWVSYLQKLMVWLFWVVLSFLHLTEYDMLNNSLGIILTSGENCGTLVPPGSWWWFLAYMFCPKVLNEVLFLFPLCLFTFPNLKLFFHMNVTQFIVCSCLDFLYSYSPTKGETVLPTNEVIELVFLCVWYPAYIHHCPKKQDQCDMLWFFVSL